ncbi:MAG: DUF4007 family protein [Syntrophomonadaceae bacterium]|nr:DUF4007 family protein [Syntrophomonadaceae bacterium]
MLAVNFHKTFIPERRLITALLEYAALGKEGTLQEISADTNIPMGKSTGKVPAIIDYARGMGLIELEIGVGQAIKKPVLTEFGRTVYLEDKFLGETVIQWLLHMNICRNDIGALAWNAVFAGGRNTLGSSFTRKQLEDYLIGIFGPGKNRTGPMILTYTDDAALARADILCLEDEKVTRRKAPLLDSYSTSYSAYILTLMEAFFPGQAQVTVLDFNNTTLWFDICLWNQLDIELMFSMVERKGYISVDRQMRPWIIEKKSTAEEVWLHIWDDMA